MKMTSCLILATAFSALASANVYKCDIDGVITYSQIPCNHDAQITEYTTEQLSSTSQPQTNQSAAEAKATMDRLSESIKKRDLRIAINRLKSDKARLQSQRDNKIAKLKSAKRSANNNLAGAVWEDSLSEEMAAIAVQYDTDVRAVDAEIDRLNDELKTL
ncbi:hypothetical protein GCM10009098_20100 [Rheinheimera aquimaris]|uniref:DUF4124 domain-containing protein n=1 Tax=Rheinheimera aquimaris TaxID=412437 RepID=A0ABN1DU95_9GAMM|nr:DUF4124 domain-containing protein [Rheinheimera aquimaris]MCB5214087.1 DUF4124 domain-containing protein [Rheinheimera aquimaris]